MLDGREVRSYKTTLSLSLSLQLVAGFGMMNPSTAPEHKNKMMSEPLLASHADLISAESLPC
jgi:hypothetical protein